MWLELQFEQLHGGKRFPMALRNWKKKLWLVPAYVVVMYIGIIGWFFVEEDSFVYHPRQGLRNADSLNIGIEAVKLMTPDSVQLVCWIIPARRHDSSSVWFLYLHGNGGNISSRGYIAHYRTFQQMDINTFAVGYRGYGLSGGSPSEQGLYTDGLAAFNYLVNERLVPPHKIILFGYSLGAAVATELATIVDAGGLIVEGAFLSAPSVGQQQYPFLPVNWTMKNRFDSISKIQNVAEPKLFLHAVNDEVIPFEHGQRLFEAAKEPKTLVETGGGHNTAHTEDSSKFYGGIMKFLKQANRSK
ncbi:MAG: alpha/beta hydrolase [Bacteroidota bacterium]